MRVPSTSRNRASHAGCAGHAGAVTRLPSTCAPSIGISIHSPPALYSTAETQRARRKGNPEDTKDRRKGENQRKMLIGTNPLLSALGPTAIWIMAAAEDPARRLGRALPSELYFRPWAGMLHSLQSSALPGTQLGAPLLLGPDGLEISAEMAWRSRYQAFVDGKRLVRTVHVHPKGGAESFDAADLSAFLRSDYPGFLDLLVTAQSASAIVRTRRFLYISAERVDRDPLLLERLHPGLRAPSAGSPSSVEKAIADARAAVRTVCHLYEIALYRGTIEAPLRLEIRPG